MVNVRMNVKPEVSPMTQPIPVMIVIQHVTLAVHPLITTVYLVMVNVILKVLNVNQNVKTLEFMKMPILTNVHLVIQLVLNVGVKQTIVVLCVPHHTTSTKAHVFPHAQMVITHKTQAKPVSHVTTNV